MSYFRSICFPQDEDCFYHPEDVDTRTRSTLLEKYHSELEKCSPRETWAGDAHKKSVPYPVLGTEKHQLQLSELSEALVLAITDIVERWWSDTDSRFPDRVPVEPVEEKLLKVRSRSCHLLTFYLNFAECFSGCNNRKDVGFVHSDSAKDLGDLTFYLNLLMTLRRSRTIESAR